MKISVAQLNPTIGDFPGNTQKIIDALEKGRQQGAQLVLFSECVITGYTAEDFLLLPSFIESAHNALQSIIPHTKGIAAVIGLPLHCPETGEKPLCNSAAIIVDQQLLGYQHKALLPTYDVFDERRYFEPGNRLRLWEIFGERIAITICEDIWEGCLEVKESTYSKNILDTFQQQHPTLFLNLSASPYHQRKIETRLGLCRKTAAALHCPVFLCNQAGGNDSLVFDGNSIYMGRHGELLHLGQSFAEDQFMVDTKASTPPILYHYHAEKELYQALVLGVRDYFHKSGLTKACLGLSGGIDSALVACIAAEALGNENVLAVLMPSRYTSQESIDDAYALAKNMHMPTREIPIESPFVSFLSLLTPYFQDIPPDVTEENLQARIRGMILMALSNKLGYTVLATGNKSELAMGYCTLYGDMCGGLAVIGDLSKTQVYAISKWINREKEIIPLNTIKKVPSAELRPNQKDSDTLPDYAILDKILQAHLEDYLPAEEIAEKYDYPLELVRKTIHKIYQSEYKRRQGPLALRVTSKAFSMGRRFPIVQKFTSRE